MHPRDLPATVVRCANCHAAGASAAAANSIAPRLTRTWLADLQSRRGGPPSRYDRDAFCALLRTGLDPTYVMINVEMPRYRVSERDCAALWAFLNEVPHVRR
ncbi:cytochrome c family protein [Burkholderia thailandensis MSMB59]|nr:cytochrome c family protein [Burkholderia thailandensis MSMB59]